MALRRREKLVSSWEDSETVTHNPAESDQRTAMQSAAGTVGSRTVNTPATTGTTGSPEVDKADANGEAESVGGFYEDDENSKEAMIMNKAILKEEGKRNAAQLFTIDGDSFYDESKLDGSLVEPTINTSEAEPSRQSRGHEGFEHAPAPDEDDFGRWARTFISESELDQLLKADHPAVKAWSVDPFPAFLKKSFNDHKLENQSQMKKLDARRKAARSQAHMY